MAGVRDSITIKLELDAQLATSKKARLVGLINNELSFGDLRDGHYHKRGWGMNQAKIIGVKLTEVKRSPHPGRDSNLDVEELGISVVSAPSNPEKRRFIMRGKVVGGIKAAIGRRIEARLTMDQLRALRNTCDRWLNEYEGA